MTSFPASGLRRLRAGDEERVAELFVGTYGAARKIDADEIRAWLANEELEPEWLRILERDGEVVGYGDIWPHEGVLELDVAAPGHWDVFLDWAEHEASARGLRRVRLQVPHRHTLAAVVAARGYQEWRHSFTMEIELERPPAPSFPAGVGARPYRGEDADVLRAALNEAFSGDPFWQEVTPRTFREFYLRARGFEPGLWRLAWDGEELAGFSLAYAGRGGDASLGWIGQLGVRPPWRRRGLGEALVRASFHDLHARGFHRAGLGVDAANETGALRLYERVGMRQVRRSDNWRREL